MYSLQLLAGLVLISVSFVSSIPYKSESYRKFLITRGGRFPGYNSQSYNDHDNDHDNNHDRGDTASVELDNERHGDLFPDLHVPQNQRGANEGLARDTSNTNRPPASHSSQDNREEQNPTTRRRRQGIPFTILGKKGTFYRSLDGTIRNGRGQRVHSNGSRYTAPEDPGTLFEIQGKPGPFYRRPDGTIRNEHGNRVNRKGQRVDSNGSPYTAPQNLGNPFEIPGKTGTFYEGPNGEIKNGSGQRVNKQGQRIGPDGKLYKRPN